MYFAWASIRTVFCVFSKNLPVFTSSGTRAASDAVFSNRERGSGEDCGVAAAIHDRKLRVRLRRVRHHHAPKARVGALDDNARSFGKLGLLVHTVTWQDRNRLISNLDRHIEFALTLMVSDRLELERLDPKIADRIGG